MSSKNYLLCCIVGVALMFSSSCELASLLGQNDKTQSSGLTNPTGIISWDARSSSIIPRIDSVSVVCGGLVYLLGGSSGSTLKNVEAYDPVSDTWSSKASMNEARRNFVAGEINGKVYVSGGLSYSDTYSVTFVRSTEVYDPILNSWTTIDTNFPFQSAPVASLGNVKLVGGVLNNRLYVMVGNSWATGRTEGYFFDPSDSNWTATAQPPSTLIDGGAISATAASGKLYVYCYSKLISYDPENDYWTSLATAPIQSNEATLVSDGTFLYAIGGEAVVNSKLEVIDRIQLFSLNSKGWEVKYKLSSPREMVTSTFVGNSLFVIGGSPQTRYSSGEILSKVEVGIP